MCPEGGDVEQRGALAWRQCDRVHIPAELGERAVEVSGEQLGAAALGARDDLEDGAMLRCHAPCFPQYPLRPEARTRVVTTTLRVLHLIKGLGRGGAERLVVDQVTLGDRADIAYEVAYLLPWKDAFVDDLASLAPVHCLGARGAYDLRWVRRFTRLVRERQIDVVHIHSPYVAGIARLALRARRSPVRTAYTMHNRAESHRWLSRWLDSHTRRFD